MDINGVAKIVVSGVVGDVPYLGGIFSGLVEAFWPPDDSPDIWDQIKSQVETLVSQDIEANNLANLKHILRGFKNDLNEYLLLTNEEEKKEKLVAIESGIDANMPKFMSGDPALSFSYFWGMALLHISVLTELKQLYADESNNKLLEKAVKGYCSYGWIATRCIRNERMEQISFYVRSRTVFGKASQWKIVVTMTDNKTRNVLVSYNQLYRNPNLDPSVLAADTVDCNAQIKEQWDLISSGVDTDLNNWARDAISAMTVKFPRTLGEGFKILKKRMDSDDYNAFLIGSYKERIQVPTFDLTKPTQN